MLLLAAVVTPVVQASASAPGGEGATRHSVRMAERESIRAAKRQRKGAERQARHAAQKAKHPFSQEREHAKLTVTCDKGITVEYFGFPESGTTTVTEIVMVDGAKLVTREFEFSGATGADTIPFTPPGRNAGYHVDVHGKWITNGKHDAYDIPAKIKCPPEPSITTQKLQRISGSQQLMTTEAITAVLGQTILYRIAVTNTGNVPLAIGSFGDPVCDAGTVVRSSQEELAVGESMTYECSHLVTEADLTNGKILNVATVDGTPPEELGSPLEGETNTVEATVTGQPKEKEPETKNEEPKGGVDTEKTSSNGSGNSGNSGGSGSKTGVLGFSSQTIPALKGPQGCVRGAFHASIKSKGVASVSFYIDLRKLKTLTSSSSRGGLLSVLINPARLSIGAHHVSARITMTGAASATSTKRAKATRAMTVVHCASAALTPRFTG